MIDIKEELNSCDCLKDSFIPGVIQAINDEWKTVSYYRGMVSSLKSEGFDDFVKVIEDIIKEEMTHIGQLTTILRTLDPQIGVGQVYIGQIEADRQITESSRVPIKESYYDVSISELGDIRDQIDNLIEMMDDTDQSSITPDPNTYGIGMPFIGTRNGYIDLRNIEKYVGDREDDYEEEGLLGNLAGGIGNAIDSVGSKIPIIGGLFGESSRLDEKDDIIDKAADFVGGAVGAVGSEIPIVRAFFGEDFEEDSLKESLSSDDIKDFLLKYSSGVSLGSPYPEHGYNDVWNIDLDSKKSISKVRRSLERDGFRLVDSYLGNPDENDEYYSYTKVTEDGDKVLASIYYNEADLDDYQLVLQIAINPEDSEMNSYFDESIVEDTVKKSNGKWTNRGDDGTEHGEFNTKKEADAQRRAMFANK